MKSCPEYKSLVDRYPDLEFNLRGDLEAHLESCGSCAEYKADADRTMQLLRALRKHLTPSDPVDQAFERLSGRLTALRRQMVWALVVHGDLHRGTVRDAAARPFAAHWLRSPRSSRLAAAGFRCLGMSNAGKPRCWASRGERAVSTRPGSGPREEDPHADGRGVLVAVWSIGFLFYLDAGSVRHRRAARRALRRFPLGIRRTAHVRRRVAATEGRAAPRSGCESWLTRSRRLLHCRTPQHRRGQSSRVFSVSITRTSCGSLRTSRVTPSSQRTSRKTCSLPFFEACRNFAASRRSGLGSTRSRCELPAATP